MTEIMSKFIKLKFNKRINIVMIFSKTYIHNNETPVSIFVINLLLAILDTYQFPIK